jgi:hypothetical protein
MLSLLYRPGYCHRDAALAAVLICPMGRNSLIKTESGLPAVNVDGYLLKNQPLENIAALFLRKYN